jgi:hypothetical protein
MMSFITDLNEGWGFKAALYPILKFLKQRFTQIWKQCFTQIWEFLKQRFIQIQAFLKQRFIHSKIFQSGAFCMKHSLKS